MLGRLKELTEINGVSGDEGQVRRYIKNIVSQYADEVWTDAMGNLYAHKKGAKRRIMACAHMDEVGMMVRGIRDDGLIAYSAAGIDPRVVPSSISASSGFTLYAAVLAPLKPSSSCTVNTP